MVAGNTADLAFAIQSAKGTPSATSIHRSYLMGGGLMPDRETADVEETSSSRLRSISYVAHAGAAGAPEMAARPGMLGALLWGAMGGKASDAGPDPFTHTFTLAATQPYMTFWRTLGTLYEQFSDCKIASLNFESGARGILKVTADIVGLAPAYQTAQETAVSVEVVEPFIHSDGKGQLQVEGSAASSISSAKISIGTGAESIDGDSVGGDQVAEGLHEITFETEQTIEDFALWNRFHYGSASPSNDAPATSGIITLGGGGLDFKWSKRDAAGADVSPERSLQFTATQVQIASIAGMDAKVDGKPLSRTVTYKIYQPSGGGSGLTAVLLNGVTAYAAT